MIGECCYHEHRAPGVCHRVQPHHLGEAHVFILVEGTRIRHLVGVVDCQSASSTVVDEACVTGGSS